MQLITIVEDEADHTRLSELAANLHNDIDCHWVRDLQSFDQLIDELTFQLVCYWMIEGPPGGLATWIKLAEKQPHVRVMLLDPEPSPASYLLAGNIGAVDVIALGNLPQLNLALHREIRTASGDLCIAPVNACADSVSPDSKLQDTQILDPITAKAIQTDLKGGGPRKGDPRSGDARSGKSRPGGAAKISHSPGQSPDSVKPAVAEVGSVGKSDESEERVLPSLVSEVNEALEQDKFELVYQPIMSVHDDSVDNYEVFVRMQRGDDLLLPQAFFPEAEKYGLMTAIDCWVVDRAIRTLNAEEDQRLEVAKESRVLPRRVRFFINVSGYSLVDKGVLSKLVRTMIAAKAGPGRIVVDVDKHTVLSRLENARTLNRNIKKLKLEFALNHYTEQDNSLDYLKHISIDYLKLQADLIDNLEKDTHKQQAIGAIVKRARENGVKTMACTVESMATMSYLYQVGVDFLQGYAIAEPGSTLEQEVFKDMA